MDTSSHPESAPSSDEDPRSRRTAAAQQRRQNPAAMTVPQPALRSSGLSDEQVTQLVAENPAVWVDGPNLLDCAARLTAVFRLQGLDVAEIGAELPTIGATIAPL